MCARKLLWSPPQANAGVIRQRVSGAYVAAKTRPILKPPRMTRLLDDERPRNACVHASLWMKVSTPVWKSFLVWSDLVAYFSGCDRIAPLGYVGCFAIHQTFVSVSGYAATTEVGMGLVPCVIGCEDTTPLK